MANNFQDGSRVPVSFFPSGGSLTQLNVKSHTLDLDVLTFDVTHTATGGNTARIGGKADAKGTVNACLDIDNPPYATAPNIIPGVRGIILFYVSAVKFTQVPVIVKKLHFESGTEQEVRWSFDVEMDAHTGSFVFPAL